MTSSDRVLEPSNVVSALVPLPDSLDTVSQSISFPILPVVYLEAGLYELRCLVNYMHVLCSIKNVLAFKCYACGQYESVQCAHAVS